VTPLFSIGVTTYMRRDLRKECLSSILQQAFRDLEIIVGNDYPEEKLSG
jgi:glycosyltransferase involved in cell wall biosynthesis